MDIFLNRDLHNSEIWLMDIDSYRLQIIGTYAKRYVEELKLSIKVFATRDRREAVRDADFVISTVLAKGYTHYETMREISERHGSFIAGVVLSEYIGNEERTLMLGSESSGFSYTSPH